MKRPAIQLYTNDLTGNAKVKRLSWPARGVWVWVICLLNAEEEHGVFRGTLHELADAIGAPMKFLREISERKVLKGCDEGKCEPFLHTPRHAGKALPTVVLLPAQPGPIWYSSRMLRDEYNRQHRGATTRFGGSNPPVIHTPTQRQGEPPTQRHGARHGERQNDTAAVHPPDGTETALLSSLSLYRKVDTPTGEDEPSIEPATATADEKKTHVKGRKPWWRDGNEVRKVGAKFGVYQRSGEDADGFKDRVFDALKHPEHRRQPSDTLPAFVEQQVTEFLNAHNGSKH